MSHPFVERVRIGLARPGIWPYAVVFFLAVLICSPYFSAYHAMDDEAVCTLGAQRILRGEIPYRDWDTRHFPGSYFLSAGWFCIAGSGLLGTRSLMLVLAGTLACLQFVLAEKVLGRPRAWLASALWLFAGVTEFPVLGYHWFATAAYLAGVLAVIRWAQEPGRRRAVWVGCWGAITVWFLQSEGLGLLLAWICLSLRRPKDFFTAFLAAVGCSFALWSPVILTAGLGPVYTGSIESMGRHASFNRSPFQASRVWEPTLYIWQNAFHGQWLWLTHSLSFLGVWYCKYIGYFPVLGLAVIGEWFQRQKGPSPLRVLLISQVCLTLACWNRQDMLYMNYLAPGFYIVLMALLERWLLVRFFIAGLFAVQCAFGIADAGSFVYPLQTLSGTYELDDLGQARALQEVYREAIRLTPPGSVTFAYPYASAFYPLSGTRNATRYPVLVPVLYSREEMQTALDQLDSAKPHFIYHYVLGMEVLKDYPTVDPARFKSEMDWFDDQIASRYSLEKQIGAVQILRHK